MFQQHGEGEMKDDQTEGTAAGVAMENRRQEQWERYRRFKEVTFAGAGKRKYAKKGDTESAG